jgi:hypothetical protein
MCEYIKNEKSLSIQPGQELKDKEEGKVLNENIDRVKVPCFCTFEYRGKRRLGLLINQSLRDAKDGSLDSYPFFTLIEMEKQTHQKVGSIIATGIGREGLERIIRSFKINIGKAEISYDEVEDFDQDASTMKSLLRNYLAPSLIALCEGSL